MSSERLTVLVIRTKGNPVLLVPKLEEPRVESRGVEVVAWDETDDPVREAAKIGGSPEKVAVGDHMWSAFLIEFLRTWRDVQWIPASELTRELRMRKDRVEIEELRRAARGIDRIMEQIPSDVRFSGRSEREVARDDGYFSDDNGTLFEEDIDAIAEAGITKGCDPPANNRYCPTLDVDRGAMAAFIRRALGLPATSTDYFVDDNNSIFEGDINAIAEAGITRGCNPLANNRYCPDDPVERGPMAAFLRRARNLPAGSTDYFTDDDKSIFEGDINAIAEAGITKGCNPRANTLYCVNNVVDRGAMAAFLRRALNLPSIVLTIPMSDHPELSCGKDGQHCTLTVDVVSARSYRTEEGLFQVMPASNQEMNEFNGASTHFTLALDGSVAGVTEMGSTTQGNISERSWRSNLSFTSGNHTLIGRWRWDVDLILTTIVTVRADP